MKNNDITYAKFTQFVESKALSISTKQEYLRQIRHLSQYYPTKSLRSITETQVFDYLVYRRDEADVRPATLNQGLVAIRSLYRDLLGKDWKLWSHFKVRFDRPLPVVLSQDETAHFLSCVREGRFLAPLSLIYHCGLRVSECLHLRPCDIDAQRLVVRLPAGKGRKMREIPIAPDMLERLRAFWSHHRNAKWLFDSLAPAQSGLCPSAARCLSRSPPGGSAPAPGRGWAKSRRTRRDAMHDSTKPMSVSSLQNAMRMTCRSTKLKKNVTCHTLRHSFATHLLEAGVSIQQVSHYLGHADLNSTMIYLHVTEVSETKGREAQSELYHRIVKRRGR